MDYRSEINLKSRSCGEGFTVKQVAFNFYEYILTVKVAVL